VSYNYSNLIGGAVGEVKSLLDGGVVLLVSPGSSRGEIVGSLQDVGVVAYRELAEELAKYRTDVEVLSVEGGRPLVGGKSLVEYIRGVGGPPESLRGWVIVPRGTIDAVLIRHQLYEELRREVGDKKAEELVKKHVKFYFPPKYYGEQLRSFVENLEKDLRKAVEVDYSDVLGDFVEDARGVSLKLVKALEMRGIDYVKAGASAIRELDPGVVGFSDVLKDAKSNILSSLLAIPFVVLASVIGGFAVAPAILAVLTASALGNVGGVIGDFLGKLAYDLGVESLKAPVAGFAGRFFEWLVKREPRNRTLTSIARLLKAVVTAKRYIDDDTFETVVDEVAAKWGLTHDAFKLFVDNLYKLATEKLVTEEELKRLKSLGDEEFKKRIEELIDERWDKFKKEVEDRLDKIEKELEELRNEIRMASVSPGSTYFDEIPGVLVEGDVVKLSNVLLRGPKKYVDYVSTPLEEAIAKEISKAALRGGGLVLVVGEKGIGKSTAAKVALAKILRGVVLVCEDEKCSEYKPYRPVVVELELQSIDKNKLKNFINTASGLEGSGEPGASKRSYLPLFYLDPSKTGHYPERAEGRYMPEKFGLYLGEAIHSLMEATGAVSLVVLSRDQYKLVENLLEGEVYRVDADEVLKDAKLDFVKGIVEKYSGCSGEASSRLAQSIVREFNDNYAVVAVLAADWLARGGCRVEEVVNAIKQSQKKVENFVLSYIWFGLLGGDQERRSQNAAKLAPLILAAGLLGPFPRKLAEVLLRAFNAHGYENHPAALWLTQDLHGTVLEALREFVVEAVKCVEGGCDYVGDDPRHVITQMRKAIISHELGKTIEEVEESLVSKLAEYSVNDVIFKAEFVEAVKRCPWVFAEAVGIASSPYSVKPLMNELEHCGLAKWLTMGGEMPRSARRFLIRVASKFDDLVKPCEIINKVFEDASREGGAGLRDYVIRLGAFAISKDGLRNCLKNASILLSLALHNAPVQVSLLKDKLVEFVKSLVENRLVREADMLIYGVVRRDPPLADDLLNIVSEKVERGEVDLSSDWVAQLLYEETSYLVYSPLPGKDDELEEWAQRVIPLVLRECSDAPCLYTKARLGARLAEFLSAIGLVPQAKDTIDEAIKAVKELEKREGLARELEPLLKLLAPFTKPEEVVGVKLADLKKLVYDVAHRIYRGFDLYKALEYAEEGYEIAKSGGLSDADLNILRGRMARVLFLMGREGEAVQMFRECMKNMRDELYVGYSNENISTITAEYIASFLAEGRVEEAVEEYRRHRGDVSRHPESLLLLTSLLHVYGLDVADEEVELKRKIFMVLESRGVPRLRGVAAALVDLYGLAKTRCEYKDLTAEDRAICETLLEIVEKPNAKLILRRWLVEQGLVEEALVEGVEDPLEMLEIVVSRVSSTSSLVEIMHLISRGRVEAARRLAEYNQRMLSKRGRVVPAVMFGELASSLGEGKCGEGCRKALLRLFYYHV